MPSACCDPAPSLSLCLCGARGHTKEETLYHPLRYKTSFCQFYPKCDRFFCPFAHSDQELRDPRTIHYELPPIHNRHPPSYSRPTAQSCYRPRAPYSSSSRRPAQRTDRRPDREEECRRDADHSTAAGLSPVSPFSAYSSNEQPITAVGVPAPPPTFGGDGGGDVVHEGARCMTGGAKATLFTVSVGGGGGGDAVSTEKEDSIKDEAAKEPAIHQKSYPFPPPFPKQVYYLPVVTGRETKTQSTQTTPSLRPSSDPPIPLTSTLLPPASVPQAQQQGAGEKGKGGTRLRCSDGRDLERTD
ncbi:unnamed protein product [Vitrella brassicaformis CCMP3155]|uniref:C3H1-type domain-containing protein n=1 Tax=Vitrella brassicaformis (strain CCMP3155) TaxID=1169540 RepID=A0A0G4F9P8_VITBC|nr:unnamed protein product [Vitrella brassicaformis CCMP3155]|eukprot:CEM09110.1 unnamed protein product [Vitrella brassicaformis CCMP3155]